MRSRIRKAAERAKLVSSTSDPSGATRSYGRNSPSAVRGSISAISLLAVNTRTTTSGSHGMTSRSRTIRSSDVVMPDRPKFMTSTGGPAVPAFICRSVIATNVESSSTWNASTKLSPITATRTVPGVFSRVRSRSRHPSALMRPSIAWSFSAKNQYGLPGVKR